MFVDWWVKPQSGAALTAPVPVSHCAVIYIIFGKPHTSFQYLKALLSPPTLALFHAFTFCGWTVPLSPLITFSPAGWGGKKGEIIATWKYFSVFNWFSSRSVAHRPRPQALSDVRAQSNDADSTLQMDWACSCLDGDDGKDDSVNRQGSASNIHLERSMQIRSAVSCRTDRADALIHPDAALLLLWIRGLQCQQVLAGAQAVVVAQHAHNQVQRVPMQNILEGSRITNISNQKRKPLFYLHLWCNDFSFLLTHWSSEATLTPYLDTPRIISLSSGTKGSFPPCC